MNKLERRFVPCRLEYREAGDDGAPPKMRGTAAVFQQLSGDLGGFRERIMPGAFDDALADDGSDVLALFNHDRNLLLGRQSSETLRVWADDDGLQYEVDLPDTSYARDLSVSMARGDVSQSSFAFYLGPQGDEWEQVDDQLIRTVNRVAELVDVSPVTLPAYPQTDAALRSMQEYIEAHEHHGTPVSVARRRLELIGVIGSP